MFQRFDNIRGLTNLIGSDGKYLISTIGQIVTETGFPVERKIDEEGFYTVELDAWNGPGEYRVADLMAIQYKGLSVIEKHYSVIEAFHIDGDKSNLIAANIGYRFLGGKLEVEGFPGFYHIPTAPGLSINEKGELLNVKTKSIRKWFVNVCRPSYKRQYKGGYRSITFVSFQGKKVSLHRHRAMMLVFREYANNCDDLVVNHIDGIPGNDTLDNLEWATRGQNNVHAYDNDLKNQHMRVLVRWVKTGDVKEFRSISYASSCLGWATDETMRQRLRTAKFGTVFQDGTQVKFKSDTRDWVEIPDPNAAILEAQEMRPVRVRDCKTLVESVYRSRKEASDATGVMVGTIAQRCNYALGRPCFGYQFFDGECDKEWPSFTEKEYLDSLRPPCHKVIARNIEDLRIVKADSTRKLAKLIGNKAYIQKLRQGDHAVTSNGWQVKYDDGSGWSDVPDLEDRLYNLRKGVMARREEDGHIVIAESIPDIVAVLNMGDRNEVRRSISLRGALVYKGYRFRLGISTEPWPIESKD